MQNKIAPFLLVVVIAAVWNINWETIGDAPAPAIIEAPSGADASEVLANAFASQAEDLPVSGSGIVSGILRDDNEGSRHQRFILELPSGQTILIAHNIDLAPRVAGLKKGDRVEFSGVYEWNERGGVVHWTHHDPAGYREGGWLRHKGRLYE